METAGIGRRIGTYQILEEVGRGGMGVVYRARDLALDRDVALKILLPKHSRDSDFEKRFAREARAAARLDHPHIVQVYAAGWCENALFIAMQFVRGQTLHDLIREKGKLPVEEALRIAREVAGALEAAHRASLVHRDIKPTNIMIDEAGRVKIVDFGLMRSSLSREDITENGVFYGTPEYASPEQCFTATLDGRTDIYSLGAVLYEMLTGRMPFASTSALELMEKIRDGNPLPIRAFRPDVPAEVERLVRRMMARKPDERFASAGQVSSEISRILAVMERPVSRISWLRCAVAALAIVAAAGAGAMAWVSRPAAKAAAGPVPVMMEEVPAPPRAGGGGLL